MPFIEVCAGKKHNRPILFRHFYRETTESTGAKRPYFAPILIVLAHGGIEHIDGLSAHGTRRESSKREGFSRVRRALGWSHHFTLADIYRRCHFAPPTLSFITEFGEEFHIDPRIGKELVSTAIPPHESFTFAREPDTRIANLDFNAFASTDSELTPEEAHAHALTMQRIAEEIVRLHTTGIPTPALSFITSAPMTAPIPSPASTPQTHSIVRGHDLQMADVLLLINGTIDLYKLLCWLCAPTYTQSNFGLITTHRYEQIKIVCCRSTYCTTCQRSKKTKERVFILDPVFRSELNALTRKRSVINFSIKLSDFFLILNKSIKNDLNTKISYSSAPHAFSGSPHLLTIKNVKQAFAEMCKAYTATLEICSAPSSVFAPPPPAAAPTSSFLTPHYDSVAIPYTPTENPYAVSPAMISCSATPTAYSTIFRDYSPPPISYSNSPQAYAPPFVTYEHFLSTDSRAFEHASGVYTANPRIYIDSLVFRLQEHLTDYITRLPRPPATISLPDLLVQLATVNRDMTYFKNEKEILQTHMIEIQSRIDLLTPTI